ncbi:hypothetical protein DB30_02327 [Enhygromyxa salina]|uniref:Uncharacterized protein n=1 Tax=Enhygromyxa salina TaxID=215803 RepID=A0A0C2CQ74_9BACT|nr:hypothetical protein [Enhygromyxa salina]KIG11880.1 hypothetical protein DB30_02327 [Enhygromyxa salina]
MNGAELPQRAILDLLYITLEHVLLTLGESPEGEVIEVIVAQARDLQNSLGEYWSGRLQPVVDDEIPF